ncbi:MAG: hypothetical protein DYG99_09065 [Bacteroidetes bacterium CHB5]|nr:hypothetical protein [Bacteroidetes bacterium CHB5]
MRASIPSGLAINEANRLLAYLKVKFQPGYFNKSLVTRLCREYGKDQRTFTKLLRSLLNDGLIGEDSKAYYLRSWKFITGIKGFNLQAFEVSLKEIRDKEIFEAMLFGAKVTSIEKAIRKGKAKERKQGCSNQIAIPSGFLAKACQISQGKVSKLKKSASFLGLLCVNKSFEDHGAGTPQAIRILKRDNPGIFLRAGRIAKRKSDQINSVVNTYRIRNRKTKKIKA